MIQTSKSMNLRRVPAGLHAAIHANAAVRGMKIAEYLEALVRLHTLARAHADAGDCASWRMELMELGLHTIAR